jgi:AraC family transcriptional regulator
MVPDVDHVVFATDSVTIGAFRCPADHPSFRDSGPIRNHCFVFPRTAVEIRHSDARPFVADPTIVTLYNRRQAYERRPVGREGDRCDWYAISPDILREVLALRDPAAADDERPIRFTHTQANPATFYAQRRLFVDVCRSAEAGGVEQLDVEERVIELLDCVLREAYRPTARLPAARALPHAAVVAEAAKRWIAPRVGEHLTLGHIARGVNCSVFHLCRSFRRATGRTLHAYREQLRLRLALERLEDGERDLTRLALDLGYSSHSHFTASFRQSFGERPSRSRRTLGHGDRASF